MQSLNIALSLFRRKVDDNTMQNYDFTFVTEPYLTYIFNTYWFCLDAVDFSAAHLNFEISNNSVSFL